MKKRTTLYAVILQKAPVDIRMYKDFVKDNFALRKDHVLKAFTLHAAKLLETIGIDPTGILNYRYLCLYIVRKN